MIITREWAMPNSQTFLIPVIDNLLKKYVGDGVGWIDPFAGSNSPAEFTNDLNPETNAKTHLDATDFVKGCKGPFKGVIFDPPYSPRQIKEEYNNLGNNYFVKTTDSPFFTEIKDIITSKLGINGYAISFGWNSNGFGKGRGFEIVEIRLVAHGGNHNDTICTVEQKTQTSLSLFRC